MKWMYVLRPQSSTFDKYSHGSLSRANRKEPVEGDKQEVEHYAYQDDRIVDLYIRLCGFPVYTP